MIAVLEDPAIRARVPAMSVEQYHRMFELSAIAEKVELIRGALIEKMPKSPIHSSIVRLLDIYFLKNLPPGWHPRAEQPLTLSDSEPEPDLAVVRGAESDFFNGHPTTAELIVEVSISTERLDRAKLEIYAEAGVRECWLLLAEERIVERHTDPQAGTYRHVERAAFPAQLESTVIPGLMLPLDGLFPV